MTDKGKRNGIIAAVLAGILGVLVAAGIIDPETAETILDAAQNLLEAMSADSVPTETATE